MRLSVHLVPGLFLLMMAALPGCRKGEPGSAPDEGRSGAMGTDSGGGVQLGEPFKTKDRVEIAKIVENPKAYEGKTVRVGGVVSAFCHHKRAWFSLVPQAGDARVIRVMTKPRFLTPEQISLNQAVAEAEGEIQLKTVPEDYARHMAKEHGLFGGVPDKIQGPQYIVSLMATGARF
jgi:hypothetical protein